MIAAVALLAAVAAGLIWPPAGALGVIWWAAHQTITRARRWVP